MPCHSRGNWWFLCIFTWTVTTWLVEVRDMKMAEAGAILPCHHVISMSNSNEPLIDLKDRVGWSGFRGWPYDLKRNLWRNFCGLRAFTWWSTAPAINNYSRPTPWLPGERVKAQGAIVSFKIWSGLDQEQKSPKAHGKWLNPRQIPWSNPMLCLWETLKASGNILFKVRYGGIRPWGDYGGRNEW